MILHVEMPVKGCGGVQQMRLDANRTESGVNTWMSNEMNLLIKRALSEHMQG